MGIIDQVLGSSCVRVRLQILIQPSFPLKVLHSSRFAGVGTPPDYKLATVRQVKKTQFFGIFVLSVPARLSGTARSAGRGIAVRNTAAGPVAAGKDDNCEPFMRKQKEGHLRGFGTAALHRSVRIFSFGIGSGREQSMQDLAGSEMVCAGRALHCFGMSTTSVNDG